MRSPSQKSRIRLHRRNGPQYRCGLIARKNPLEVATQLLIFRYHDTTGAIDMLLLRFGCQEEDHLVGALWVCGKFSGFGTSAKIRLCAIDLEIGQRGADSRSILPLYALGNGSACVVCPLCVGNQLHSRVMTRRTRTSRISSTCPPQYHFLNGFAYPRQNDDSKASIRTAYIHAEIL